MRSKYTLAAVEAFIANAKKKLIKSAEGRGITENFGQRDVRKAHQMAENVVGARFGASDAAHAQKLAQDFDNWAAEYAG